MGFSSAVLGASQLAFRTADKPIIVAAHALRDATKTAEKWTLTGTIAGADNTVGAARGPISRVYDGYAHQGLHSRPSTNQLTWYLVLDVNTTPISFDSMILHGSNLYLDTGLTIKLQIANSADFATDLTTISTITPGANQFRFVDLDLDHVASGSRLYSAVEYVRLEFVSSATRAPRVREFWLGTQRQFEYLPNTPWDAERESSSAPQTISKSGVITAPRGMRARAERSIVLLLSTPSQIAMADSIWADSLEGTESFYWIETPGSDPKAYLMRMRGRPEYNPQLVDGMNRSWAFDVQEQNPFLALDPA